MPTNTLTSLAMLKVNIDHGGDYLDYLNPFILQVLVDNRPDPVTNPVVRDLIEQQYGLEIPERTVEIVLKRIARREALKRDHGIYRIVGDLPDPRISPRQAAAERHIGAVLYGLQQLSRNTMNPISSDEEAVRVLCAFLSEFDVTCLRAYLRGTTIPTLEGIHHADIVLVSNYVRHLQHSDPERFDSFLVLVQGHMLANALTCPDLDNVSDNYRQVTFYLDTPLLIHLLGLEGRTKQDSARELIALLRRLGGKVAAFSHSIDEFQRVLRGSAANLDTTEPPRPIVVEARRRGTTRSDLLLLAESIVDRVLRTGIAIETTPRYVNDLQIDETAFEQVLDDQISYYNTRAKEDDINSVRSIYVIRDGTPALSIEKARAVLVTSNAAFARAAWEYGQLYEVSRDVSSVLTDFSLANMAWLKVPMGAPNVPMTQLLAFSHAALEPSSELLGRYLNEIDRLEREGTITERDHQLLRSSPLVYDELMRLTLGDDAALTSETITQTLERVTSEIRQDETARLTAEEEAHRATLNELEASHEGQRKIQERIYWNADRRAKTYTDILTGLVGLFMAGDLVASVAVLLTGSSLAVLVALPFLLAAGTLTFVSRWYGFSIRGVRPRVKNWIRAQLFKRQAAAIGIDVSESAL